MSVNLNPPLTQKPIARYEKSSYLCAVKPFFTLQLGCRKNVIPLQPKTITNKFFLWHTIITIIITSMTTNMRFIAVNIIMSIITATSIIMVMSTIMSTGA